MFFFKIKMPLKYSNILLLDRYLFWIEHNIFELFYANKLHDKLIKVGKIIIVEVRPWSLHKQVG